MIAQGRDYTRKHVNKGRSNVFVRVAAKLLKLALFLFFDIKFFIVLFIDENPIAFSSSYFALFFTEKLAVLLQYLYLI